MPKFLVPVDGSDASARAVTKFVSMLGWYAGPVEVHLLNVQPEIPYGGRVSGYLGKEMITKFHQEEGLAALQPARSLLDAAGVAYRYHIGVGEPADVICRYAEDQSCDHIVMGTRGLGTVSNLILGSVATRVVHLSPVPVLLLK